jgi:nitroreductase
MMVNETLEVIRRRRSIRRYLAKQISGSEINQILEAAVFAPSAMNQQKWHFAVVQNKSVLSRMVQITRKNKLRSNISVLVKMAQEEDYHTYHGAPTVVIVSGEEQTKFVELDCAMAAQNIALAAESMGIGSCIMTSAGLLFASVEGLEMKKELGIPKGYKHICSIALGYRMDDPCMVPPRNREVFSNVQ